METPYVDPVAQKGFVVVKRRIAMVVYSRLWYLHIHIACAAVKDHVRWVKNDPELMFLKDQAQKRNHDARNEVQERAREALVV
jgi:hypothetical protein